MNSLKLNNNINTNTINNMESKLKMIDLCAGTGAFSYIFEKTGKVECIFANDMMDSSEKIYNLNHNIKLTKKDINLIKPEDIPKHNILTAGFPCQSFSIAGEKKGFDDERANVFWTIIKILEYHNPEIVILENVKNLQSHDNGKTFEIIYNNLKKLGYYIRYNILNTCEITEIPQNRERIYIVCFKNKKLYKKFDLVFDNIEKKDIKNYLESNIPIKYYYTEKFKVYDEVKKNVIKHINENVIYQYRRYYVRENKNNVCPTLTANMGGGGHNVPLLLDDNGIRKLTPKECFNLQGFPTDYVLPNISDSELYKLAGNAVSMPVIKLIIEKLINLID